jgi:hypothetical protein
LIYFDLTGFPPKFSTTVNTFEELGFTEDAAVSLPRRIRHNSNLVWIADNSTLEILWDRLQDFFVEGPEGAFFGRKPIGLNGRFRVYRYQEGDFFKYHTDGSWPGTRVSKPKNPKNGQLDENHYELVRDFFPHQAWSMYTILFFLTDDFEGGETEFLIQSIDSTHPAEQVTHTSTVDVRTPLGGVLCFPHGEHPWHCRHSSTPITTGIKYIIRSDVLFEL